MKIIQKSCPHCGAPLKFSEEDKKTICQYCKQEISIARKNKNKANEDYILSVENYYKGKYYQTTVSKLIGIFFALVVVGIIILFLIISMNHSKQKEDFFIPEKQYITELSQIDKESQKQISNKSLEELSKMKKENVEQTEWQFIGQYFLRHKENNNQNKIYDMYVKEYIIEGAVVKGYAGVEYSPLELTDEKILLIPYRGKVFCPHTSVLGYESNEDFYNKVIRNETNQYIVSST